MVRIDSNLNLTLTNILIMLLIIVSVASSSDLANPYMIASFYYTIDNMTNQ